MISRQQRFPVSALNYVITKVNKNVWTQVLQEALLRAQALLQEALLMVVPLLPIMAAGLAVSGGANLYSQWNQRKLYRRELNAYENLDKGYRSYLAGHGRTINPDRAWTSYYGQAERLRTNITNSYAGSVGTVGGTVGAGAGLSRSVFNSPTTRKWL